MKLYVDTGLLAAYYTPEPLSGEVEALLQAFPGPAVSDLTKVELLATLTRKVRAAGLAASDAQRIRMLFLAHLEDGLYTRLPLRRRHYQLAREWVGRGTVPLDAAVALHLAAAALAERSLATSDPALIDAGRELGVDVLLVGIPEGEEVLTVYEQSLALFD